MIAFGHTAVGAAIGLAGYHFLSTQPPPIGLSLTFGAGLISHYITDFIPHGHFFNELDYKKKVIYAIIFDLFLSVLLFVGIEFILKGLDLKLFYLIFGIAGAQVPDVLDGLIYTGYLPKKGLFKLEMNFHRSLHWHGLGKHTLMFGKRDIWQIMTVLIAFILLINL